MSTVYVDRDEASQVLKVSTRTVDRYVRKYKLKTKKDGRLLLIRRTDVDRIIRDQIGHLVDLEAPSFSNSPSLKPSESQIQLTEMKVEETRQKPASSVEEKVYKDLYQETKKDLQAKQERLEAATYRVGQLETQLKGMVPLLEYSQKEKELQQTQTSLEQKAVEAQQAIGAVQKSLQAERMAKWIYLSLSALLLVVEPLLFLLWAFA